jgi:hypothetical protein
VCHIIHVLQNLVLTHTDVIATKVCVVEPLDAAEAGPSSLAERPKQLMKGKGKVTEEKSAANGEGKVIGLSDEQWGVRQQFLADCMLWK